MRKLGGKKILGKPPALLSPEANPSYVRGDWVLFGRGVTATTAAQTLGGMGSGAGSTL